MRAVVGLRLAASMLLILSISAPSEAQVGMGHLIPEGRPGYQRAFHEHIRVGPSQYRQSRDANHQPSDKRSQPNPGNDRL